jgi:branched-chain amino acid transport system substrate-binding protein
VVKIGLVAPFEGRYRAIGYDVIYAARLALHEVNQAGGVGGYAVELVAYDDGSQPAMAMEQARKLNVDPDVLAAIGHFREETTRAAVGAYAQGGLPLVAPGVVDPDLTRDQEALYRLGPSAPVLAAPLLERAAQLAGASPGRTQGGGEIVLLGQGGPLGASLQHLAREREAEEPGWRFTTVSADAADWRTDVLARDPAVILCDLDPTRAGEVVAALRQGGWSGPVLGGPALASSDFVAVAGPSGQGATFVTPWPFPPDVPGGDAFAVVYRDASDGVEPGPLALPAYEATWMLLEALDRATAGGEPTRQAISAALSGVEREGVLGRVTFDEAHGWSGDSFYWYRIGPEGVPRLTETARQTRVASLADPARWRENG